MKHHLMGGLLVCALLAGSTALAQEATYVFPYEGFRYTQREDETVLTQTNLDAHLELIESLGTTKEAVLASYVASGIVMEVIPDEGGQIAVSVTDAGEFKNVLHMDEINADQKQAFLDQFAASGLYETCGYVHTTPLCVRMTSSAMYASMPVYTLRYATLHMGRMYVISQTIVGRAPEEADDERMEKLLGGMKLLNSVTEATPAPTTTPAPTPVPTPEPTIGTAEVLETVGGLVLDDVPGFVNDAEITLKGKAEASAVVEAYVGDKSLGRATAKKDGTFALKVKLPEEGDVQLTVESGENRVVLALHYEMPIARLEIEPQESPTFTGGSVIVRGVTEPRATIYVTGKGMDTNVQAGKNGNFSIRIFMDEEGTQTYNLRVKAEGFAQNSQDVTVTRVLTEKERIAEFRQKMISVNYNTLMKSPEKYGGKRFIFRGRVMSFSDYNGSPCALVCVDNPATGVWKDPIYVVLSAQEDVKEGDVRTFYMMSEGITIPVEGTYTKSGQEEEAPVVRAVYITDTK